MLTDIIFLQELENYRSAMSRMAADIITLRTQVLTLETENSQLRTHLHLNPDLGRHLLDDADIAVMTKAEIAEHMGKNQSRTLNWSSDVKPF